MRYLRLTRNHESRRKIAILLMLLLCAAAPRAGAEVSLVLSSKDLSFQTVAAGFKAAFSGPVKVYQLEGSDQRQQEVGEAMKASPPQAVVAVGDLAARMTEWLPEELPVIYCNTMQGLPLIKQGRKGIIVYHEPDPKEQARVISRLFSPEATIGVFYSPDYTFLEETLFQEMPMPPSMKVKPIPLRSIREVPVEVKQTLPRVDLVWLFTDPVVLSRHSVQFVLLQAFSAGKPVFCGNESLARAGATAGLVPELTEVGIQAAHYAEKIIVGDSPPAAKVVYPKGKLVLNCKIAGLLQIAFPEGLIAEAAKVIK